MKNLRSIAMALALLAAGGALAQYPNKSIHMIVPYPPGGATDVIGRVLAERLGKALGQPVVIENRGGAGGNIGAEVVARAPADGYTILMAALTSHSIMATLEQATIRYNIEKDLVPVCIAASVPLVWVVHPSVPAKTMKELVAYVKSKPGEISYASSGAGAPQRMAAELFRRSANLDMIHVPYKGSGPAMTDLVSGQVLTMAETVPAALQFIKAGRLRALAVTTPQRISMLPDVPTTSEQGIPGIEVSSLFGVMVPAGTPKPIVDRLNAELAKILQQRETQEQLLLQGAYAVSTTPEQAQTRVHDEVARWAKVVEEAHVKPD